LFEKKNFFKGNISLLKAYASSASTQRDRSRAIALVTGGVALGMTMGPGLVYFLFCFYFLSFICGIFGYKNDCLGGRGFEPARGRNFFILHKFYLIV